MGDQQEIKLVFEGSSIDADFVKNKTMGNLFHHYAIHGGFQPVKIYVKKPDFENARGIIATYFKS